jgi:hypothetical protein
MMLALDRAFSTDINELWCVARCWVCFVILEVCERCDVLVLCLWSDDCRQSCTQGVISWKIVRGGRWVKRSGGVEDVETR